MPAAEVDVSVGLVRRLLAAQHPDLAGLELAVLAKGWDNLVCAVGADYLCSCPDARPGRGVDGARAALAAGARAAAGRPDGASGADIPTASQQAEVLGDPVRPG
jgi:hypothetical protein